MGDIPMYSIVRSFRLRCRIAFRLANAQIASHSAHQVRGACMSILETVILTLVMVWTPALAFVAYLLIPRSTD